MKNELQILYETALAISQKNPVGPVVPGVHDGFEEQILKLLQARTTELIISTVKADRDSSAKQIGAIMIQLFTLMAHEGITLEEINEMLKTSIK